MPTGATTLIRALVAHPCVLTRVESGEQMAKPARFMWRICHFLLNPAEWTHSVDNLHTEIFLSAFAVLYERSNSPANLDAFQRVMERLNHRGPDGSATSSFGNVLMGHWHFWTTPEEVGERQPLAVTGLPFNIVLDGRLDNREELFAGLGIDSAEGKDISDAGLVLRAYARWEENCLEHFIGEYAFVIWDEERCQMICARDSLGERTLFYTLLGAQVVIASEPWALAGISERALELNEDTIAHFFALQTSESGQTFFKDIYEVPPAHALAISPSSHRLRRVWQPDPEARLHYRSDEEYAEEFRGLLELSVRSRMRSSAPVGVLMSGGLDSTSIACLAARMCPQMTLTAISYIFDEIEECDERKYIHAVTTQYPIRAIEILSDNAWTFKTNEQLPKNSNYPSENPFRLLYEQGYACAQSEGLRVLLTGEGGDHLFVAGVYWLADLLSEGKLLKIFQELKHLRSASKWRWFLNAGFLQRAARKLLDTFPGGKYVRRRQTGPGWLSPLSLMYVLNPVNKLANPMFKKYASMLGEEIVRLLTNEVSYASPHEIELRHPYRDRRLLEFIMMLPTWQLYAHGGYKYILRGAMRGILPEVIRLRPNKTVFNPLFFRGIEREKISLKAHTQNSDAAWRKFVSEQWIKEQKDLTISGHMSYELFVHWLCVSYATWHQNVFP